MSKTFANTASYPLDWPDSFPRTVKVEESRFQTTLFKALENVKTELKKFGADSGKGLENVVISSNYSLSDVAPKDSGVCVYFIWDGEQTCIPVDRYRKVECNLQAIYHCISAKRTMLRHGGINLVKAAFRGYTALPPPATDWCDVLMVPADVSLAGARAAYQREIKKHHPDRGGESKQAAKINMAWENAKKELAQGRS